jgi:protein ImuB
VSNPTSSTWPAADVPTESRTLLVWCPDWPVIAAEIIDGVPARSAVAVMHANRVIATSDAARREGVRRGLRKRDAQSRCPGLVVVDDDPSRDARAFEPVVAAVEEVAAGVAIIRPGVCALAARGPATYFGGEEAAAERIVEQVAIECGVEAQIGVAEGAFAALLAAREGRLIPPGATPAFLAAMPIATLDRPPLTGLLERMGIRTLGAFAALSAADVAVRFGLDGAVAHRLAAGSDDRPLAVRMPPPDLDVEERLEEPIERVDVAAFAARALAERLHERLSGYGLACTRLVITAITTEGIELHREWRHDGVLTATAIADRTRWQLDGWLTRRARTGEVAPGGIVVLRLSPHGVLAQIGMQPGLWGEAGEERDRAHRALHRVQGMLGPDAVQRAILGGGNDPGGRVTLVPWGEEYRPERSDGPWPDRLPSPSPATVFAAPAPVEVLDAADRPVTVTPRLLLSGGPARLVIDRVPVEIVDWAGPWPVDEHWWDRRTARAVLRFQVLLADGRMLLLALSAGQWEAVADYD